jgi:hypothetical protein
LERVRTRLPDVFVGHPFAGRFPVRRFRAIFHALPFNVVYGNTDLQTKHLLAVLKASIARCDYALFDLSDWNANVALELGLTEGLGKKPGKAYYILLNTRRSREVPSDVRGIQRLEYSSYDFKRGAGLGDRLMTHILAREHRVKKIWRAIPDSDKGRKQRLMAMRVLAYLRDHERLTADHLRSLARGSRLRTVDRTRTIEVLERSGAIRKSRGGEVFVRGRGLFRG